MDRLWRPIQSSPATSNGRPAPALIAEPGDVDKVYVSGESQVFNTRDGNKTQRKDIEQISPAGCAQPPAAISPVKLTRSDVTLAEDFN